MNALETDPTTESTVAATPRRSTRRGLALALAALCVTGITVGLAVAGPDDGPAPQTVETPVDDAPSPPVVAPKALTDASRLELNRIGPIVVGMTLAEASAAHGKPVTIDPRTDRGRGCAHAAAEGGPEGLQFMVVNGRIVRIEVFQGPVATAEGITTGSPVQDVLAAYAGRIRVEPHTYAAPIGGQYLIVDETSGGTSMTILFETDGKQVRRFRSGLTQAVMAPEGCS